MRHLTLIIAAVVLAVAAPALAGKGGNGNGAGKGELGEGEPAGKPQEYAPSLAVSWPLATTENQDTPYVISGCGFDASYGSVRLVVSTPVSVGSAGQMPNGDGCVSFDNASTQGPGHYEIEAWQEVRNKLEVVASTSFDVG
jgi:hypothetical protein